MVGSAPLTLIEVFADIGCPFTHVGLRRFVARRAELGRPEVVLRVRPWPLELVNGVPLDPDFLAEEIEEIRAQLVVSEFAGFDPRSFPDSTLPPMALAEQAYAADVRTGEAVSLALRDRLFESGQDVAAGPVLAEVAAAHGLPAPVGEPDLAAVEASWEDGRRRGVIGSPHFFTPAGDFFCPALDVSKVDGHLRITADPEGFAAFIDGCFA